MNIHSPVKGNTSKSAMVSGAKSKDEAVEAVMEYFRETPDRLFDLSAFAWDDGSFFVTLYTG